MFTRRTQFPAVASMLLGALVVYLAAPRLMAGLSTFSGDEALRQVRTGAPLDAQKIKTVIVSRDRALQWINSGQLRIELGAFQFRQALKASADGQVPRDQLEGVIGTLELGLSRSPIDAAGWTRLASARFELEGATPRVADALKMSLFTGPYQPGLVFSRLALSLVVIEQFTQQEQGLIVKQIGYAWQVSPERLVELAASANQTWLFRRALSGVPLDLARFEKMLRERQAGGGSTG